MFLRHVNQVEEAIISLLPVSMTLLVRFEVVLRFGYGTGLSWGQELTLHLSAWFVLFGVSYGLKVGAHIGVDAFVRLFSPAIQRLCPLWRSCSVWRTAPCFFMDPGSISKRCTRSG